MVSALRREKGQCRPVLVAAGATPSAWTHCGSVWGMRHAGLSAEPGSELTSPWQLVSPINNTVLPSWRLPQFSICPGEQGSLKVTLF